MFLPSAWEFCKSCTANSVVATEKLLLHSRASTGCDVIPFIRSSLSAASAGGTAAQAHSCSASAARTSRQPLSFNIFIIIIPSGLRFRLFRLVDYAEEQEDVVFSGALGEVMVDAAAYQQSKVKNDFDYSKPARHYRKLKNYPKDEAEYSAMLDEIVEQNNAEGENG